MLIPPNPPDEALRLETLHSLKILDTEPEERFDRITRVAAQLFNVPVAIVSLIDANRQWFKSCQGISAKETPRSISFCAHAILGDDVFCVNDALLDPRFADNPLVIGEPHIRFYAGFPIAAENGTKLGTLCIVDRKPRQISERETQLLRDLGYWVHTELNLVKGLQAEIARQAEALQENERMFFGLIEGLPVGVFVLDSSGKPYYTNRLGQKILGKAPTQEGSEGLSNQLQLYMLGTSQEYPADRLTSVRALRGEASEIDDLEVHRGDLVIPLQAWGAPIRNSQGNIAYAVAVFQDISQRRQTERRTAAQHAVTNVLATSTGLDDAAPGILQHICEAIGWEVGALWCVDRKGESLRCMDLWHSPTSNFSHFTAMLRKFTFPSGMGLCGRVWASGEPAWIENVGEDTNFPLGPAALTDGLRSAFAFPILLRKSAIGVVEFFATRIHKPDPELLSVFNSLSAQIGQFVARTWAEKALHDSEERYRLLTENSQDLIALLSPEAKILFASPSFLHVLGQHPAALTDADFLAMLHPEDAPKVPPLLEEAIRSKTGQTSELRLHKQDGSWLQVEVILSAISGSPKRILLSGRRMHEKPEEKTGILKRLGF